MKNSTSVDTLVRQGRGKKQLNWIPTVLIGLSIAYISLIIYIPAINVFYQAFHKGIEPFLSNFGEPDFLNAVKVTLLLALIVVPINTVFGLCAAWSIARHQFPGRTLLLSIIDLPLSISPVVAGLMIMLLYGRQGWFGSWFQAQGIDIVFALPGMILATAFVSMPFVVREVIPVLEEAGVDQEEAARTLGASDWQIFWRVTLPNIRWGLMYGILLTNARAMGEFGAVSVVSGNVASTTQSLPLFVEEAYKDYNTEAAFSAAVLLALLAAVTLVLKEILESKTRIKDQ
jgi:sulfate/thiosulfate transport system permease protein